MTIHTFARVEIAEKCAQYTYQMITAFLSQGPTLLLISGGSVGLEVILALNKFFEKEELKNGRELTVALVDERFGKPYHANSNMLLIKNTGLLTFLETHGASFIKPLTGKNSLEEEVHEYTVKINSVLEKSQNRVVGIFGIGTDGHTAGVKPMEDSLAFEKLFMGPEMLAGYKAQDYERMTMTLTVISQLPHAIIYAHGSEKKEVLEKIMKAPESDMHTMPGIIFQKHKNTHLFTDQRVN